MLRSMPETDPASVVPPGAWPPPGRRRLGRAGAGIQVRAFAPGRVNLIGDHTDYTGGWVLPMAIEQGTTIELRRHGRRVEVVSDHEPVAAVVDLPRPGPAAGWARYVAGVVEALHPGTGGTGVVSSDLPLGAGLSSSSSLTVALALALGFEGTELELARACQRAETAGSGVPGGIMDQLCSAAGRPGAALLIDCGRLEVTEVPLPARWEVLVAHCGRPRTLVGSAYAERRAQCEAAEALIGPLREAGPADAESIPDPVLRRRARHVVSENGRVLRFAGLVSEGDLAGAGRAMTESHRSLRDDFEVSTPDLDELVGRLQAVPGVAGARLTGAGFGGCVVALAEVGTFPRLAAVPLPGPFWVVRPAGGAWLQLI